MSGTVAFMSAHLRLTDTFSPVFSSTVWITWSRSFFSSFPPLFWVSWNDLVTTHGLARTSRNRSLICALTSVTSATFKQKHLPVSRTARGRRVEINLKELK